ncbi:MAG: hypothetical protein H0V17_26290 [Deltaproteobacteria bacterium]|nr:hypothetical protein [Deltaproteobacteria bacterium]
MLRLALLASILTACGADGPAVDPNDPLPPPSEEDGIQIAYQVDVQPGEEVWKCNVFDLPSPRFFPINHAESVQNDAMHHMDLIATAFGAPDIEPGEYDCKDVYAQFPKLMDDGVIIYASQQAEQQILLPEGTVADLLPRMRLMHEIHFVNPTDVPVTAYSKINAYEYKQDADKSIWGGAVRDLDINVPANTTSHVEWTRCVMNKDVDVLFLSTHTHALAKETVIRRFDPLGPTSVAGEPIYSNTDWHAPPLQDYTAAPLHIPAGSGFEFECHYENHSGMPVSWGFDAADEMCQIALVYTPGEATRHCDIVESGVR